MTDREIIDLYFKRNESALEKSEQKYGEYCKATAMRILNDPRDAEECVNDALLSAWNRIPPDDPDDLGAFLAKITRNISVDRVRRINAEKRGGGEIPLILDELDECIGGERSAEDVYISDEFSKAVNGFLKKLPKRERDMFVARYTLAYSVSDIAEAFDCGENSVRSALSKARKKLCRMLSEEDMI